MVMEEGMSMMKAFPVVKPTSILLKIAPGLVPSVGSEQCLGTHNWGGAVAGDSMVDKGTLG